MELREIVSSTQSHDDIKWEHFPRYWPFGQSPDSTHEGQWRGALMFSLYSTWTNGWANNRDDGDLRRHRTHHDVIVMFILSVDYLVTLRVWARVATVLILNYGLLPDKQNCGLRMHRECRECFVRHLLQKKPLVSYPGMYHGTCVTHEDRRSGSLTWNLQVHDLQMSSNEKVWMAAGYHPSNGCHLTCPIKTHSDRNKMAITLDHVSKCIFINQNLRILTKISLNVVPKCSIHNKPALV